MSSGYFGIGTYECKKPFNLGNLMRSAYAFNADFFYTINLLPYDIKTLEVSDKSHSSNNMPYFHYNNFEEMKIPEKAKLIGVEITDNAIDIFDFKHPKQAIYILGPEDGSIPQNILDKCDFVIKIPSQYCLNLGNAGVVVMYDRMYKKYLSTIERYQKDK